MKTITHDSSVIRADIYRILMLVFFLSCLFLHVLSRAEECLFAIQLRDPVIRAEYEAVIAAGITNDASRNGVIDPLALQCLACHDGTVASAARYRISDGTLYTVKSIETITGAHPIGMNYDIATMNREFAPEETLPAGMVLMYGRVGCVTCHNLLGSNDKYHAVDNAASGLCFACHRK